MSSVEAPEAILTPWVERGGFILPPDRRLRRLLVRVEVSILDEDAIDRDEAGCVLGHAGMSFQATESSRTETVRRNAELQLENALQAAVADARAGWENES